MNKWDFFESVHQHIGCFLCLPAVRAGRSEPKHRGNIVAQHRGHQQLSRSLYIRVSHCFVRRFFTLIHSLILRANFDDSPRLQNNGKSRRHSREEKVSLISVLVIGARRRNFKLHRAAWDYSRSRVQRVSFNDLGDDPQSSSREERKAGNELKFNSSSE